MNAIARTPRLARTALFGTCLLAALALATGCAKKMTTPDAGYTTPEGVPSANAVMIAWPDLPVVQSKWLDRPEIDANNQSVLGTWNPQTGPTDTKGDSLISSQPLYASRAGAMHGFIVSTSAADSFNVLRREVNGGLRAFLPDPLPPFRQWLDGGANVYYFTDPAPSGAVPARYIGQGLLHGAVRSQSPLTNEAAVSLNGVGDIPTSLTAHLQQDSLFTIAWAPVSGAAGYWVQVFSYQPSASEMDKLLGAAPAPLVTAPTHDSFVGFFRTCPASYRIGDPGPTIFTFRLADFQFGLTYSVRIAAVDASGQLIAYTQGGTPKDAVVATAPGPTGYILVSPRGAMNIEVSKPKSLQR